MKPHMLNHRLQGFSFLIEQPAQHLLGAALAPDDQSQISDDFWSKKVVEFTEFSAKAFVTDLRFLQNQNAPPGLSRGKNPGRVHQFGSQAPEIAGLQHYLEHGVTKHGICPEIRQIVESGLKLKLAHDVKMRL